MTLPPNDTDVLTIRKQVPLPRLIISESPSKRYVVLTELQGNGRRRSNPAWHRHRWHFEVSLAQPTVCYNNYAIRISIMEDDEREDEPHVNEICYASTMQHPGAVQHIWISQIKILRVRSGEEVQQITTALFDTTTSAIVFASSRPRRSAFLFTLTSTNLIAFPTHWAKQSSLPTP